MFDPAGTPRPSRLKKAKIIQQNDTYAADLDFSRKTRRTPLPFLYPKPWNRYSRRIHIRVGFLADARSCELPKGCFGKGVCKVNINPTCMD